MTSTGDAVFNPLTLQNMPRHCHTIKSDSDTSSIQKYDTLYSNRWENTSIHKKSSHVFISVVFVPFLPSTIHDQQICSSTDISEYNYGKVRHKRAQVLRQVTLKQIVL
mmetsp:Transcript_8865/g.17621  ORF Transcript_8865/g.17621 Transcript_8865/m.17621 type:complete len:108 (-) Transcript_8865:82-405(-)